jgi:hypothetical protein
VEVDSANREDLPVERGRIDGDFLAGRA